MFLSDFTVLDTYKLLQQYVKFMYILQKTVDFMKNVEGAQRENRNLVDVPKVANFEKTLLVKGPTKVEDGLLLGELIRRV